MFKTVMGIKDKVADLMPQIEELKDSIVQLVEEASSAFEDPLETLKEVRALGGEGGLLWLHRTHRESVCGIAGL